MEIEIGDGPGPELDNIQTDGILASTYSSWFLVRLRILEDKGLQLSLSKLGSEQPIMSHTFDCWATVRYLAIGTKEGQTATWYWPGGSSIKSYGKYEYFKPNRADGGLFNSKLQNTDIKIAYILYFRP